MKAKCTCGKEFDFTPQTETVDGVDVVYAECPTCGKRYFSYVQDSEIKERIEKTKYVRKIYQQDYIEKTRELMREKQKQYSDIIDSVINRQFAQSHE